ncbi:unnamed protein product [Plutella xylostella]|uniref:Putative alpha-L-fucosidase n=1 Tax=Plutella xylostella TaxID=51655 RepID=A0A8S4FFK8_PLUXY|nr:unnamed protein product [Plutella xylostella]
MMKRLVIFLFSVSYAAAVCISAKCETGRYQPNWESLDKRPLPEWYDKAKIGIFLHWGVFSVPSYGSEWFWSNWHGNNSIHVDFMKKNYRPGFTYQEFAPMLTAEFFNPDEWAKLFQRAGAKYVVLTSKHHEGFTMFPSKKSFSWNSVEVGPHRDIVGELGKAVKDHGLVFGVYHSLFEWFNPIYLKDKYELFATRDYPTTKLWPDLKQLINDYEPSVLWSDGDWEALDSYWNSTDFLAWLYNDSPVKDRIVVNDRWGIGIPCHHGDFYNCQDRYNPGKLQNHKWENAFTLDSKSWGWRRDLQLRDLMTLDDLIKEVVSTVSCGGNALINVGPTKEGTIAPIFQERLLSFGKWLRVNGEAIYESSPWQHQNDSRNTNVWYTCRKTSYDGLRPTSKPLKTDKVSATYAIFLKWPANNVLQVKDLTPYLHSGNFAVGMLGKAGETLNWTISNGLTYITLPDKATVRTEHAWALRITLK